MSALEEAFDRWIAGDLDYDPQTSSREDHEYDNPEPPDTYNVNKSRAELLWELFGITDTDK